MINSISWLHISDIHFGKNSEWRDEVSRDSLLNYLQKLYEMRPNLRPDLIFCTGDIAFGESKNDPINSQYAKAREFFDKLLAICGTDCVLPRERLFVVPGNHDVDRSKVNMDAQEIYAKFSANSESSSLEINKRFNLKTNEFLDAVKRLDAYGEFIRDYLPHQFDKDGRHVFAQLIEIRGTSVGVAGFNSAWTCAGPEDDRNIWLAAEWQFNHVAPVIRDAHIRIGLIHHPFDWLNTAERNLGTRRATTDFDFWLHGHTHNAWVSPTNNGITISAGAVTGGATEEFGVNSTLIDLQRCIGTTFLHSRRAADAGWTIAPVAIHAPDGQWAYPLPQRLKQLSQDTGGKMPNHAHPVESSREGMISRLFSRRLDDALRSFSNHTILWVDRIISSSPETVRDAEQSPQIYLATLISEPVSAIIKAPPQYGLTCLAHKLVSDAWNQPIPKLFIYLDAKTIKPNKASVDQAISDELQMLGKKRQDISCVILDSIDPDEKSAHKIIQIVSDEFKELPIIVLAQVNTGNFSLAVIECNNRNFSHYFLWALSRNVIRNIVATYNEHRVIGDEDAVTARLAADLEVLNLHRTPLNCITLLKVSEAEFDESPVNRCDVIRRVLFLLFNNDVLPSYKSKPDLKDCEFVLGYFCEGLIRNANYLFARDKFLVDIQNFCRANLVDLETHLVFDILYRNNIIIKIGHLFKFRFSYWVFYFGAQRMHHEKSFADHILSDNRYSLYPEIIEFYTGIDRMRDNALQTLAEDLRSMRRGVQENCSLPEDVNPYKYAVWSVSDEGRARMEEEIINGVKESNLPVAIKDQFADKSYNRAKPYDQDIRNVLHAHKFVDMLRAMSAGARALRNSDYAAAEIKRELLTEIMKCWAQLTRALFVILPLLAKDGYAAYDGMGFSLGDGFSEAPKDRVPAILGCIPANVASWVRDDLYSRKMGPLLIEQISSSNIDDIERHQLLLVLISSRPRDWERIVQRYIAEVGKNSFYLMDVTFALRNEYRIGFFAEKSTMAAVEHLIKLSSAKHLTGDKLPNEKTLKRLSNYLPDRIVPDPQ